MGCSRMVRGGLSQASWFFPPHPNAGLEGLSKHVRRVLLLWQDGNRAQEMGWEGGRRSLLLPLPCKATCTPLALWLVGQENVFFQKHKKKREHNIHQNKIPGAVRGLEQDNVQPKAGEV